jgi:HEAT repeat protein
VREAHRKTDPVEKALSEIHAVRHNPRSPEALAVLSRTLGDKCNFVVAAAATLVAEFELQTLLPLLSSAFQRFLHSPQKTDKGCKAKTALADALYRNGSQDEALFRIGLRHVQPEPVWGGHQDTAAELRGISALALAQLAPLGIVYELSDLLADPEPTARALCARALGASGLEEALPLLRYKLRVGDSAGEVLLECYAALLGLSPKRALPLLKETLAASNESHREAAALALGQSRHEEALPLLKDFAERLPVSERRVALTAIAMLRGEAALAYLLELVATGDLPLAVGATRALAMHRYDQALSQRVKETAKKRGDAELLHTVTEAFS